MKKHNFKKILALLIAIIMVIPAIPVVASAATIEYQTPTANTTKWPTVDDWLEDIKVVEDGKTYYEIKTKEELTYFMLVGSDTPTNLSAYGVEEADQLARDRTYRLGADIDWNKGALDKTTGEFVPESGNVIDTWTPYWQNTAWGATNVKFDLDGDGEEETTKSEYWYKGFRGTFDGNGYSINGLVIKGDTTTNKVLNGAAAFFKRVGNGAVIKNLTFKNMYVSNTDRCTAALIGVVQGDVTVENVSIDANINANLGVGGIIGRPMWDDFADKTITIKNTCVSGNINCTGGRAVGGFIGATGGHKVVMQDCVSYVNITGAGDYVSGFIGASEDALTMNNCSYLGTNSVSATYISALANAGDLKTANGSVGSYPTINETDPDSTANFPVSFTGCYFYSDTAENAATVFSTSKVDAAKWYDITVNGTKLTFSESLSSSNNAGNIAKHMTDNMFKKVTIAPGDATAIALDGVQMGKDNNARFVSYINNKTGISAVDYQVIKLNDLAAGNTSKMDTVNCANAYKTLADNYGTGELKAGENGYYVALAICRVQADTDNYTYDGSAETILVRNKIVVNEVEQYSQWMAVTFANGMIIGCAYVG